MCSYKLLCTQTHAMSTPLERKKKTCIGEPTCKAFMYMSSSEYLHQCMYEKENSVEKKKIKVVDWWESALPCMAAWTIH